MKRVQLLFLIVFLFIGTLTQAQPMFDVYFVEGTSNETTYEVKVQVVSRTEAFNLASSNITFNYDNTKLSSPTLTTAHNFNGVDAGPPMSIYGDMTVTSPAGGIVSVNINFTQTFAFSKEVNTTPIDVATISFTVDNQDTDYGLTLRGTSEATAPMNIYEKKSDESTAPVMPVELGTFDASVSENTVILKWNTVTEVDNYGFEVERKLADDETAQFEKVGFVAGAGNSNSEKSYTFSDKVERTGTFEYRLKQIDNDGSYTYYEAVEVDIEGPTAYELDQNYPNPFNPSTTIKFALPEAAKVDLVVYNVLGQKVATLVNQELDMGYHTVNFDGSRFASGTYFYRIATDNFTSIKKMILIK